MRTDPPDPARIGQFQPRIFVRLHPAEMPPTPNRCDQHSGEARLASLDFDPCPGPSPHHHPIGKGVVLPLPESARRDESGSATSESGV
jgi:hypothetical protein